MRVHELKEWPATFEKNGRMDFAELRDGRDRYFRVGDLLHIREWSPDLDYSSGRERVARITRVHYGAQYGLGEVVLLECRRVMEVHNPAEPRPSEGAR